MLERLPGIVWLLWGASSCHARWVAVLACFYAGAVAYEGLAEWKTAHAKTQA
jgi:hypothetical protein